MQHNKFILALGAAGLLPFIGGVLGLWLWPEQAARLTLGMLTYGAVILSFLGGTHWGLALNNPTAPRFILIAAMFPPLLGWVAQFINTTQGLWLLAAAFLLTLWPDYVLHQRGGTARDYFICRSALSADAALLLALAAWLQPQF